MERKTFSRRALLTGNGALNRFGGAIVNEIQEQPVETVESNRLLRRARENMSRRSATAFFLGLGVGIVNLTQAQPAETTVRGRVNGKVIEFSEPYLKLDKFQNFIDQGSAVLTALGMLGFAKAATMGVIPVAEVIDKRTKNDVNQIFDTAKKIFHIPNRGTIFSPETPLQIPAPSPKHID